MTATNTPPSDSPIADRRRNEIANAAIDIIAAQGFEGLRTRDVAAKVGINIATLHYHVPSKEALAELVAERMRLYFMGQSVRRPRDGRPPLERLRAEFADMRETFFERPAYIEVLAELMRRAIRDERIDAIIRPMLTHWSETYASILSDGKSDGSFRADLDATAQSLIITGAFIGLRRQPDMTEDQFDALKAEIERSILSPSDNASTLHDDQPSRR